jgi:PAS domain S-box-containing protein
MASVVLLGITIVLQVIAAVFALRPIRITTGWPGWGLLTLAVVLLTLQHCLGVARVTAGEAPLPPLGTAVLALGISVCLVASTAWLAPLFVSLRCTSEAMRRTSEEELQTQRQAYETLFHAVPVELRLKDTNNRLVRVNHTAAEADGSTVAALEGQSCWDLYSAELAAREHADDLEVIRTGQPKRNVVAPYPTAAGTLRWVQVDRLPYRDRDGTISGVLVAAMDITERQHAEDALAARIEQMEAVRTVAEEMTRELDLPTLLELMAQRARDLLRADNSAIYLWDEATQTVIPRAWCNIGAWFDAVRLRLGEGLVGTVAQRREGLLVNDYQQSPYALPMYVPYLRQSAIMAEPLVYRDQLVGVMIVAHVEPERHFTAQDRDLLAVFAAQAAVAIENARLFAESRQRQMWLTSILEMNTHLAMSADLPHLLDRIAEEAARLVAADGAILRLVQSTRLVVAGTTQDRLTTALAPELPLGEGVIGRTVQENRVFVVPDVQAHPDIPQGAKAHAAATGLCSFCSLPVRSRHQVIGALAVTSAQPRVFTADESAALTICAEQAAIAVENMQLVDEVTARQAALEHANTELHHEIEARQRAEEAARASQRLLHAIIEHSPAVISVKDLQGRYMMVNRRYAELFHISQEAMVGKSDDDVFATEVAAAFRATDQRVVATDSALIAEEVAPHDDGLHAYVSVKCPLRDDTGTPYAVCSISTDITERQHAEEERQKFVSLVEQSDDFIGMGGLDGNVLYVNRGGCQLVGLDPAQAPGTPLSALYPAAWWQQLEEEVLPRVMRGAGNWVGEAQLRHYHTRELIDVLMNLFSVHDPATGRLLCIAMVMRDITERKRASQQLQEQVGRLDLLQGITRAIGERQDLRSIFQVVLGTLEDSLPLDFGCVCLHDPGAHVLTVTSVGSRSHTRAMELVLHEHTPIPVEPNVLSRCVQGQVVYEPDIGDVPDPFPQRLAQSGLRALVVAPLVVESHVFGVLVAARQQPRSFSSGECEFLRQLSEHVALAAHQAQLYAALQQAYDDLRQTQRAVMQQERLRALGQMASGIAHDINNAIAPVTLYTESLLETEPHLSERARRQLETMARAIDDVAETVARMREFYRLREPERALVPVHLNRLVPQVVDLTRARWSDMPQQRGVVIQIQTDLQPNVPTIMGVESELREALTNLVLNAVDAMPDGGRLTLRTHLVDNESAPAEAPRQPSVDVEVTDTGVGMDEDTQQRCLEPFFTTKGERGTGLGLAMVYGIVQRHGADLDIASIVGQGTTVRLRFAVPATPAAGASQPAAAIAVPARLRILVVEDDPLLRQSLAESLATDGHVVVTAPGGQEGIDAFRAAHTRGEPYAVVLTDLGMPYVDGRQVAQAVKALAPTTPVLLLTGWGQQLVADQAVPPQVDRVVSKPPKLRDLREALAQCCPPAGS